MKTGGLQEALCGFHKKKEKKNRSAVDEAYLLKAFLKSATVEGQHDVCINVCFQMNIN